MTSANVRVREDVPGQVLVHLEGEIDLDNARTVEQQLAAAVTNKAVSVSLDCTEVEYLDSAGLRVLFALADRLALLQVRLEMTVPAGSPIRKAVELSGLGSVVDLHR
ncbi:STAS domain-containing protein [Pseudonocardia pini]|uniref:STAS domain-containing protein n=1 Tax=Pseudonocardia pini TaxID=2758030 RepID=UPI0015F06051|nr:STAS domain-containing protein [Pseudonocardia pini]